VNVALDCILRGIFGIGILLFPVPPTKQTKKLSTTGSPHPHGMVFNWNLENHKKDDGRVETLLVLNAISWIQPITFATMLLPGTPEEARFYILLTTFFLELIQWFLYPTIIISLSSKKYRFCFDMGPVREFGLELMAFLVFGVYFLVLGAVGVATIKWSLFSILNSWGYQDGELKLALSFHEYLMTVVFACAIISTLFGVLFACLRTVHFVIYICSSMFCRFWVGVQEA